MAVQSHVDDQPNLFQSVVGYVGVLLRLERRLLALVVSYSLAIGLFALIVPLTVQELTNTFAFAIQPALRPCCHRDCTADSAVSVPRL